MSEYIVGLTSQVGNTGLGQPLFQVGRLRTSWVKLPNPVDL